MKIMKLLAACAMVGALATTTAMAAESDFLGEYDATNNAIAINLAAEDVADYAKTATGDLTVLVTNVDAAGTISNTNIFQIDQGTLASLENDTDEDANVKLAVLKLSAAVATDYTAVTTKATGAPASSTYYVRLGGGTVADETTGAQVAGYIYDTFTFNAPVADDKVEVTVDNTTANAFGTTGSSAVIVTAKSAIPAGKAVAYDGTPMYYTEYTVDGQTVVKYVALCANFDSTKIALVDGANTKIMYGNLSGTDSPVINSLDLNSMLTIVLDNSKANTDVVKLTADVNADGSTNSLDLNEVLSMVLNPLYVPKAALK